MRTRTRNLVVPSGLGLDIEDLIGGLLLDLAQPASRTVASAKKAAPTVAEQQARRAELRRGVVSEIRQAKLRAAAKAEAERAARVQHCKEMQQLVDAEDERNRINSGMSASQARLARAIVMP